VKSTIVLIVKLTLFDIHARLQLTQGALLRQPISVTNSYFQYNLVSIKGCDSNEF